jgi:protein-S-isoprenylcysteine O-methyltransferase Ste14
MITASNPFSKSLPWTRVGDVALATLWIVIAVTNVGKTIENEHHESLMSIAHHFASASILFLGAALFILRRPARAAAEGVMPRVIAVIGTWMMPVAVNMPFTWQADWYLGLSTLALLGSSVLIAWSLLTLRRSFSIFAEARELVHSGPYAIVRHPLYATYTGMYLIMLFPRLSLLALIVTVLAVACEVWRARYEEAILRRTFPEYTEYAAVTPAFIPRVQSFSR